MENNNEKVTLKSIFESVLLVTVIMYGVYYFTKDLFTFIFTIVDRITSNSSKEENDYEELDDDYIMYE
jgi:hypothetical protein